MAMATMTMNGAGIAEKVAEATGDLPRRADSPRLLAPRAARGLEALLKKEESSIFEALWADLRKPRLEAYLTEVGFVIGEIDDALEHLDKWMKPERKHTSLLAQPGRSWTTHDPLGVVLVIGAWNYPVQLLLAPLVGALAGGNAAVLKPSEIAAHTSALMADLVPRYLDPEAVSVVEGGADETQALLDERFDLIFFTGGSHVGQIVLEKAAKHLTPVVLELGGKSPCLVDRDASLEVAARRIAWGRFSNAGQTCVAPDYVLVHEAVELELLAHLRAAVTSFYGDDPRVSPDYWPDRQRPQLREAVEAAQGRRGRLRRQGRGQGAIHRADDPPERVAQGAGHAGGDLRPDPAGAHRPEHGRGDRVRDGPPQAARALLVLEQRGDAAEGRRPDELGQRLHQRRHHAHGRAGAALRWRR